MLANPFLDDGTRGQRKTFQRFLFQRIADLTNGLQFVKVKDRVLRRAETPEIRLESDAPLPRKPVARLLAGKTYFSQSLGAGSESWYYPFLSPELVDVHPLKGDACLLFDKGVIQVPKVGESDENGGDKDEPELLIHDPNPNQNLVGGEEPNLGDSKAGDVYAIQ